MPWTDQDDLNWSIYETDSIRRLDNIGTTPPGREMFRDLLRGGRARVRAHGFNSNDMQRARSNTDGFLDHAARQAGGDQIDVQHLDSAIIAFCPIYPIC